MASTLYTTSGATLFVQNPPAASTLTAPLPLTGIESVHGFDIPHAPNALGYAIVKPTGATTFSLATIDLTNGTTTIVGALDGAPHGLALAFVAPR